MITTKLAQDAPKRTGIDLDPRSIDHLPKYSTNHHQRRFPKARTWDHAIDLKPDAKPYAGKAYSLDNNQKEALQDVHFRESGERLHSTFHFPLGGPFFFVGKKDGKLRPCQDYRRLNEQTIPKQIPATTNPRINRQAQRSQDFYETRS